MTAAQKAYREYLQTEKWRTIAAQRLALDGHECVLCGGVAENVHHRRYPRQWGEETILDLVSLCGECHAKHHGMEMMRTPVRETIPPTAEMLDVRKEMIDAESAGDEERVTRLLYLYTSLRKAQLVG